MKKLSVLILAMALLAGAVSAVRVSPGSFCVQNVEIGKDLDLKMDLAILNDSDKEQVFTVRSIKPSQATAYWLKGYAEIPDASWFYFAKDQIRVKPEQQGYVRMHLKIPYSESYYNQRWMVYLDVTNVPPKGSMLRLSIKPACMIETQAKTDITTPPHGVLGLVPGTVKAEGVVRGEEKKVQFSLYNNDSIAHTYKIYTFMPDTSGQRQAISVTPKFEWVGAADWVGPEKSGLIGWLFGWLNPTQTDIELEPKEMKNITVNVRVPKDAELSRKGWEAIMMVEPDRELSGFVRVLIEPEKGRR